MFPRACALLAGLSLAVTCLSGADSNARPAPERIRLLIETDAGGDPDDEQSLVRFLLYASEWDVEGIIANRARARDGENRNPERTGVGIVRRLVRAYAECQPNLARHDARFPSGDTLLARVLDGTDASEAGVRRIIEAVDSPDPRPLWYSDWGSDRGSSTNNLRRALDRVLRERGPEGYARFKRRIQLSSSDAFGPHTFETAPAFTLWIDPWRPAIGGRRWYHQFSRIVAPAGGFDPHRDLLHGHGPLGALYPTNTGPLWKEGDSLSFIHLIPTGLGDPALPSLGGWGGRFGPRDDAHGRPYWWAGVADTWNGATHRDQTLARWAAAIQNDFRARLDWCVAPPEGANHPPVVVSASPRRQTVRAGERVELSVRGSHDPDRHPLKVRWESYPEAGSGPVTLQPVDETSVAFTAPSTPAPASYHVIASVEDAGDPPLTRYARFIVEVDPNLPIRSAPLPSGPGLAALYPGDAGIASDPRVLLFEDFEIPSKSALPSRWESVSDQDGRVIALVPDAPPGSPGTNSIEFTATLGKDTGGHLYRRLPRAVDRAFARFLVRFDETNGYTHHFVHFGGYNPSTAWPQGGAGERPAGNERFTVGVEPFGDYGRHRPPGLWNLYTYWQEMKVSAGNRYWGNGLRPARDFAATPGAWQCLEVMVQLNSAPDRHDGELALWVDGRLALHLAPGSRRTEWTGMGLTQLAEGGAPFEGFRWRNSDDLKVNFFWLLDYVTENVARQNRVTDPPRVNRVRFDHIVVAEDYIGPVTSSPPSK